MSLLNTRGQNSNTVIVKRFLSDAAFATRRIGSVTDSYLSREWVGLNNYYLKDDRQSTTYHVGFDADSTIIIRCTLATDAVGPLFGVTGKARVMCESGSIKWYNDSGTAVHTVTIDGKRHDIGVYSDNGSLKPFYDGGVTTASAMTTRTTERDFYPCVLSTDANNGAATGVCLSSATQTYAIKIHEIAGRFLEVASGSALTPFLHFYSCNRDGSETTPFMFETRGRSAIVLGAIVGTAISGVTAAAGLGEHVTYGIQLHDLREAFGSYYTQLLAVLCDDGGVDRGGGEAAQYYAGWDDYKATNTDVTKNADCEESFVHSAKTYKSAFYLDTAHLPSGYTSLQRPDYYASLEDGQLIRGRKPKWSIWNDAINFGKYIKSVHVQTASEDYYRKDFVFNIFKDVYGRNIFTLDHPDMLGVFDGYNTSLTKCYPPLITTPDIQPTLKFYLDANFDPAADGSTIYANGTATYPYNMTATGGFTARLGNLPWWNLTYDEQAAPSGYNALRVYGLVAVMRARDDSAQWREISKAVALCEETHVVNGGTYPLPLCKESTTDKVKFKEQGVDLGLTYSKYGDFARLEDGNEVRTNVVMYMPLIYDRNPNIKTYCVDCSSVVPSKYIDTVTQRNISTLNLIGEQGATVMVSDKVYNVYMNSYTIPSDYDVAIYEGTPAFPYYYHATGIEFMLVPKYAQRETASYSSTSALPDAGDYYTIYITTNNNKYYLYRYSSYVEATVLSYSSYNNFPAQGQADTIYRDTSTGYYYMLPARQDDALDLFEQVNNVWKPKVYVYLETTRGWSIAHSVGCYSNDLVTGTFSTFPSSGNASRYYFDTSDGKIYHWVSGTGYVEDEVVNIPYGSSFPAVSSSNYHKTFHKYKSQDDYDIFRLSEVLCDQGETGVYAYVLSPEWRYKGIIRKKYNGWAIPFAYQDLSAMSTFNQVSDPFVASGQNFVYLYQNIGKPGRSTRKLALSTFYFNFLESALVGGAHNILGPEKWSRNSYQTYSEPAYTRYRIFDANNLPHSWGVYAQAGTFSDSGEGWLLGAANGCTYLVMDRDHIIDNSNTIVVNAHLMLFNANKVRKDLASDFAPFKVTMFRQDPCRPYQYSNNQYIDTQYYDSTYLTQIFYEQPMNAVNVDSSEITGSDGVKYTMHVYASTDLDNDVVKYDGVASDITRKYGILNPYCFKLQIRITSNGGQAVKGSNYLIYFSY